MITFALECSKMRCRLGLHPRPRWGAYRLLSVEGEGIMVLPAQKSWGLVSSESYNIQYIHCIPSPI